MTEIITAIYENGVLRPLRPLNLKERQRVQVKVVSEPAEDRNESIIRALIDDGLVEPRESPLTTDPVTEVQRLALAHQIGQVPGKPLSALALEDRGEW